MLRLSIIILIIFILLAACTDSDQPEPEKVVRDYVTQINNGNLSAAKALCTPAGAAYLEALQGVIFATESSVDTTAIVIESIKCTTSSDGTTAKCLLKADDGYEIYEEEHDLKQTASGWRIDHLTEDGQKNSTTEEVVPPQKSINE